MRRRNIYCSTIMGLLWYTKQLYDSSVITIETTFTQTPPVESTTKEATTETSHVFLPCEYR